MKGKNISCIVILLVLVASFTTVGLGKQATENEQQTFTLQYPEPKTSVTAIGTEVYSEINMGSADNTYYVGGAPVLPMYVKSLEFPLGTNIISVDFQPQGIQTAMIPFKIQPATQPVTLDTENPQTQYIADQSIYSSAQFFPNNWFDYSTGGGLNSDMQHTTFLNIRTFPVRYSPATNTIEYIHNAVVTVSYKLPEKPLIINNTYQLVIIAPKAWSSDLKKLVDDKVAKGITTNFTTLEDIYAKYTTGYDKPEQIKLFIYDAVKNWGTQYVLIVGGYKGYLLGRGGKDNPNEGVKNWYFPVRYANNDEGGTEHDPGLISDLYYADVCNANGSFSSWDSNHDHVYAKWTAPPVGKDIIDLYPDVAVGRIAARNTNELNIIVDKIIKYEAVAPDPSWFKRMVLVAGDTDADPGTNIPEGEYTTSFIYNESMRAAGFVATKLYSTNHNKSLDDLTPTPSNIIREISKGCGFLFFDGHGNALSWNTHWYKMIIWGRGNTPGGLHIYQMIKFKNKDKLPVCIVGGCHNCMINISLIWSLTGGTYTWVYHQPCPRSWGEWMVAKKGGGAIACVGNTGLGIGYAGLNCIKGLGEYINRMFFKSYNESTSKTFGSAWTGAITQYLQKFPGMNVQADCKTIEEWLPLGDPSLVIG